MLTLAQFEELLHIIHAYEADAVPLISSPGEVVIKVTRCPPSREEALYVDLRYAARDMGVPLTVRFPTASIWSSKNRFVKGAPPAPAEYAEITVVVYRKFNKKGSRYVAEIDGREKIIGKAKFTEDKTPMAQRYALATRIGNERFGTCEIVNHTYDKGKSYFTIRKRKQDAPKRTTAANPPHPEEAQPAGRPNAAHDRLRLVGGAGADAHGYDTRAGEGKGGAK